MTDPRFAARRVLQSIAVAAVILLVTGGLTRPVDAVRKHPLDKLDRALRDALAGGAAGEERVIIQTAPRASGALAATLARSGRQIHAEADLVGAVCATVDLSDLQPLAALADVEHISVDAPIRPQVTSGDILRDTLGLVPGGGITSSGSSWAGEGIGVAVVDSGIEPSKDLDSKRITAFYDFTRGGMAVKPFDNYGHGTHVAGLIGGSGDLSSDHYEGAAPKARFIGYKVLDAGGSGYTSGVIAAINHAIKNKDRLKIDVMNLSLGHPILEPAGTDPLVRAVEYAAAAGVVVVVSAGNYGVDPSTSLPAYAGITSPGNAPSAITVGATDTKETVTRLDDEVTPYSSRGPTWYDLYPKPDLVAPGHRLVAVAALQCSLYKEYPSLRVAYGSDIPRYFRLSGTSMAAGVTSGIVAVMLEATRDTWGGGRLSPNTVKALLEFTAFRIPQTDLLTQGAGAINAVGAIRLASAINPAVPMSGTWTGAVSEHDVIGGTAIDWAGEVVWADRLVWGKVVYTHEPAWALGVAWGDLAVWGDRLVWGTTEIVWDSRLVWGTRLVWGNSVLGYDNGTYVLYGDDIDWQSVSGDRLVWGKLADVVAGTSDTSVGAISTRY